jgi:D-tyrosyl-tRNA(Tyr) deacylase
MRVVVQRVQSAQVTVQDQVIAQIGAGLLLLVGITATDTEAELDWMARKCLSLRVFPNPAQSERDRWDASVQDIQGALLVVSQFTLYGDCRKGRRPSFIQAAAPALAEPLYDDFVQRLKASGLTVATGQFGADMAVALVNDGPVTLWLER